MLSEKAKQEHLEFQLRVLKNISHDIRTNINEIQGYLTFLERRELREEEIEHLLQARSATKALRYSIDKLLNFSMLNANELVLNREWFYFDDLLIEVAESTSEKAEEKGLRFLLETDTGTAPVYGDAARIKEMLLYLLENAVKFTSKGFVLLRVERRSEGTEERINVTVKDSGIGMSPAEIREVCEPYVRFVEGEKGLGLGLYFSRIIAEKMGAFLRIDSVPNEGTSVGVDMRLKRGEERDAERLRGRRIVCYCDRELRQHPEVKELSRRVLEGFGIEADIFTDEARFSQYLVSVGDQAPDIVSVSTLPENYEHYGMLFAFLKKSETYAGTLFIAQRIGTQVIPEHFDCGFELHAGVEGYLECLEKGGRPEEANTGLYIMIVDDLSSNIEILKLFLGKIAPEATVDTAQGGYEAIGMYKTRQYDLILMDLKMPGLNGFQVLERFQEIAPLPPVYAVTAEVYEETRQQIEHSGFLGLLEKPFNPEQLKQVIKEAVHAKNHR